MAYERTEERVGADRDKALDMALSQIDKQFGKGSIMRMGEKGSMAIEAISTGALPLDLALGVGGLPRGRVVEIFGPESSGKSTLAMHVVAEAQRNGGICAYIDAEHAMDPIYAQAIGVDVDELLISQPDTGEQALEITDMLDPLRCARRRRDRLGGRPHAPGRDRGRDGRHPRRPPGPPHDPGAAQAHRQPQQDRTPSAIFINQLREKIGVMFGSPETTPGGRALKFYSSVRLDIRRIESIKDGVEVVGNRTRVKVVKNKVRPALPPGRVRHHVRQGRSAARARCSTSAVDLGIVKKSGAWYTYEGEQLGQGRENAKAVPGREPRDHGRDLRAGAPAGRPAAGPERARRLHPRRRGAHRARLSFVARPPLRFGWLLLSFARRLQVGSRLQPGAVVGSLYGDRRPWSRAATSCAPSGAR